MVERFATKEEIDELRAEFGTAQQGNTRLSLCRSHALSLSFSLCLSPPILYYALAECRAFIAANRDSSARDKAVTDTRF